MLHTLQSLLAPPVMERLTLVINHVLGSETVAMERLKPHAGRTVQLVADRWPSLLPPPPQLVFRVTPAGLMEWCGLEHDAPCDLTLRLDGSNPALLAARAFAGEMPAVEVIGDAQLAGDVNWLIQNLRWDVAADLERLFGPVVAQQLHRLGSALAHALKSAMHGMSQLRERFGPR